MNLSCVVQEDSSDEKCHFFVKTALQPLVEVLLGQLTKQEEGQDLDDNIWNVSMASGTALSLVAQTVADDIVPLAMPYVQVISSRNLRHNQLLTASRLLCGRA